MPLLINTRPAYVPMPVVAGVDVVNLPLLDIVYRDGLDVVTHQNMMSLMAGRVSTVLAVSVPAVSAGVDFLRRQGISCADDLPHMPHTVAVGDATATALREFGFTVSVPDVPHQNNEGMLQLPAIRKLTQGDELMIWQGVGGRVHLKDSLVARGVRIMPVVWYERCEPTQLSAQISALADTIAEVDALYVIISSEQSWHGWQRHVAMINHPNLTYLTLGGRLYDIVGQMSTDKRVLMADLTNVSLAQAICHTPI